MAFCAVCVTHSACLYLCSLSLLPFQPTSMKGAGESCFLHTSDLALWCIFYCAIILNYCLLFFLWIFSLTCVAFDCAFIKILFCTLVWMMLIYSCLYLGHVNTSWFIHKCSLQMVLYHIIWMNKNSLLFFLQSLYTEYQAFYRQCVWIISRWRSIFGREIPWI